MKITTTDILAVWGAIVSTIAVGWNIFRDILQREKLIVRASIMRTFPDQKDILNWSFTNKSKHELTVTHLAAMPLHRWHPLWLFGRVNRRRNGMQLVFPFDFLNGSLPIRVGPLNNAMAAYDLQKLKFTEGFGELYAITADGREWFVDQKSIKEILGNKIFRASLGHL